ncbi:chromate transporter [Bradyrhizobium sp. Tv2a-2]|uniref:chromate transporter n=1 Tax=Bradyrhizobium sp. Tv2a-2 TaxID=113395 RepID=UPI000404428E|nr:chromate transporter [Bradyrhizobium sp. Tv2a-2]
MVRYFLRLGCLGFGGPVALVGQMERELVDGKKWLTKDQMREAIACQSLPGPLAIQVGIYISYLRGGFWGAWAGGWAFILPNFIIVAALGALYVYLGDLQPVTAIVRVVSVMPQLEGDRPEVKIVLLAGKQFSTASEHLD